MIRTRADLDRKIAQLEIRARELTPRRYARRHLPEHALDRAVGGILTLVGLRMAWKQVRQRRNRRAQLRAAAVGHGGW
ncbi:MAG TPA: hypothetical protein VIX63_11400 [Vicinamibacterales bacterium]